MAGITSVPQIEFTPAGLVVPDESAIRAGVAADFSAAFGGNLNTGASTPQGQLIDSEAALIGAKNDQFAYFVSQIDPATASGFMQDAIGRLYFLDRLPARSTVVSVICRGRTGVFIAAGSLALDSSGQQYASLADATIPAAGFVTVQFAAVGTGPLPCPAGSIVSIYRTVPGWDSVENTEPGILGTNVESRADFESRRQQSVALNAIGSLPSIYAAVFAVDGVTDIYVAENTASTSQTIGGQTLVAKSIYVAAVGGAPSDIANAIWRKKSVGASYNGNTSVTVVDDSGYSYPYPTYTVKYQIPAARPILFAVQLANLPNMPADIVAQVKDAIVNAFSGGDGGPRARIGATIYASRFYAPVSAIAPGAIQILSLQIGTTTANQSAVTLGIGDAPTIDASNITVSLV